MPEFKRLIILPLGFWGYAMRHLCSLFVSAAAIFGALASAVPQASAASVACKVSSVHPVCVAVFEKFPAGSKKKNERMAGSAVVDGKTVRWTCRGAESRRHPRECQY